MKTASGGLATFLFTKQAFVTANLYTITLLGGGTVLRWTDAEIPLTFGGHTWTPGPVITDGGVTQKIGLDVSSLEVSLQSDGRTQISGVDLITFARRRGLGGALVLVERIYLPSWDDAPIGTVIRFSGRYSELRSINQSGLQFTCTSWTELLDTNMPVDVYQASCLNTIYDTKCTLLRSTFKATVVVVSGTTLVLLKTSYGGADGVMTLGSLLFTSGPLSGTRRSVKDQTAGNLTLSAPLPALPIIGDTLEIYPGCDLRQSTCLSKFNNLVNFRGQPYVPVPETAL